MSILQNAIDSISLGIADYQLATADNRRYVSCTRNIFAGILLLFKHKLSELSPIGSDEVLIKQKILPKIDIGCIVWVGEGKKTVDVQGIKERFNSLNINIDWKKLTDVQTYRNDIEHYYATTSIGAIQKMISDSFIVIVEFISTYLRQDPRTLLGSETYDVMREVDDVYKADKGICTTKLQSLGYFTNTIYDAISSGTCSQCSSGLIMSEQENVSADCTEYVCRSCDHVMEYKDFVQASFERKYAVSFRDIANGSEDNRLECPECKGYFFYDEGMCVCCGYEIVTVCDICEADIPSSELLYSEGTCSYCQYHYEKMMEE